MSQCPILKHLLQLLVKPMWLLGSGERTKHSELPRMFVLSPQRRRIDPGFEAGLQKNAVWPPRLEIGERVNRDSLRPKLCLAILTLNLFKKKTHKPPYILQAKEAHGFTCCLYV